MGTTYWATIPPLACLHDTLEKFRQPLPPGAVPAAVLANGVICCSEGLFLRDVFGVLLILAQPRYVIPMLLQPPRNGLETVAVVEAAGDRVDDLMRDSVSNGVFPSLFEKDEGKIHLEHAIETMGPAAGPGEPGVKSDGPNHAGFVPLLNQQPTDFLDLIADITKRPDSPARFVSDEWDSRYFCF